MDAFRGEERPFFLCSLLLALDVPDDGTEHHGEMRQDGVLDRRFVVACDEHSSVHAFELVDLVFQVVHA